MIHLAALDTFDFQADEKAVLVKFIREQLLDCTHIVKKEALARHGLV